MQALCNLVGLQNSAYAPSGYSFSGTGPTWELPVFMQQLSCKGRETSILDCDYEPVEGDEHPACETVRVECGDPVKGEW